MDRHQTTRGSQSEGLDFEVVAYNVLCQRMAINKTQADLAARAGVSLSTIRRLEAGLPVHPGNLQKVCDAVGKTVDFITSPSVYGRPAERGRVVIHRKADLRWFAHHDRRRRIPPDTQDRIQQEEERVRLARLGFVAMFEAFTVMMPYGPSISIAELCSVWRQAPHEYYRSSVVLCFRGEILVKVADSTFRLAEGDGIGFGGDEDVTLEPSSKIGPDGIPPLICFVMANRKGHVPIEFEGMRRRRIRHGVRRNT